MFWGHDLFPPRFQSRIGNLPRMNFSDWKIWLYVTYVTYPYRLTLYLIDQPR